MPRKIPAWQMLVSQGFVTTRMDAERWILSGNVLSGGARVLTAGQLLPVSSSLQIRGFDRKYVSKGGEKLEGALAAFALDITGRHCIDAGASSGGFTDCLVKHGAALVYAVDVGYGQLAGSLRGHPAVVNLERTNIGDEKLLSLAPRPSLATVDLSYLSLRKAVPQFAQILHHQGDLVCLVKPLFEIDDAEARRTGVIPPGAYAPLLHSLSGAFTRMGHQVCGATNSPVTGNNGTLEFFLWLRLCEKSGGLCEPDLALAIESAVSTALALPAYHKT